MTCDNCGRNAAITVTVGARTECLRCGGETGLTRAYVAMVTPREYLMADRVRADLAASGKLR